MATLRPPFSDYIRYMAAQHLSANQHFINLSATDSLRPTAGEYLNLSYFNVG